MCQIRPATQDDLDALVSHGERFFAYSRMAQFASFDPQLARASIAALVESGIALVAVIGGQIVGGILGVMAPVWFNPSIQAATEFAWWVQDEYRGSTAGIKLLRAFEQWAKERGAAMVCMSDLVIDGAMPAGRLFEKLDYVVVERSHVKKVN